MQNFYYKVTGSVLPIEHYKAEYEGKILCEDPNCRQPIKFIAGTSKIRPYMRIVSPNKHYDKCTACSKSKNKGLSIKNKYVANSDVIPVISLNLKSSQNQTKRKISRIKRNTSRKVLKAKKGSLERFRRLRLDSFDKVAKYINTNYENKGILQFLVGNKEKNFNKVIYEPNYVFQNIDSLIKTRVYMLGYVRNLNIHNLLPHVSLYVETQGNHYLKVFIPYEIVDHNEIFNLQGRTILCYGMVNKYGGSPQVTISSFKHISKITTKIRT